MANGGCYVHFHILRSSVALKGEKYEADLPVCLGRGAVAKELLRLQLVFILFCAKTSERGQAQICMFRDILQQGGCLHDHVFMFSYRFLDNSGRTNSHVCAV